jgi:hypothetical protein
MPTEAKLKMPRSWRFLKTFAALRADGEAKLTGENRFGISVVTGLATDCLQGLSSTKSKLTPPRQASG